MSVRHLEVLWAVIRTGSQHEASRLLGLSQPAISKIVRYIEERIGVPLFRRMRGRLYPTPEGQVFFGVLDDIFSRVEGAQRLANDLQRRVGGLIIVATVPGLIDEFVPKALSQFVQSHPLLKLCLKVLPPSLVVERVATEQADIALDFAPVNPGSVEMHRLCSVPIVCGIPHGHRLERHHVITASDLAGERLISAFNGPRWENSVNAAFLRAGVQPHAVIDCTQASLAFSLAEAGAGIAVVPFVPRSQYVRQNLTIRPLSPQIDIELVAVTNRSHPLSQPLALLIDHQQCLARRMFWDGHGSPLIQADAFTTRVRRGPAPY